MVFTKKINVVMKSRNVVMYTYNRFSSDNSRRVSMKFGVFVQYPCHCLFKHRNHKSFFYAVKYNILTKKNVSSTNLEIGSHIRCWNIGVDSNEVVNLLN